MKDNKYDFSINEDYSFELILNISTSNKFFKKLLESETLKSRLNKKDVDYKGQTDIVEHFVIDNSCSTAIKAYLKMIDGGCRKEVKRDVRIVKKDGVKVLSCDIVKAEYKKVGEIWNVTVHYGGMCEYGN